MDFHGLQALARRDLSIADLLTPGRVAACTIEACGLAFDFSRTAIDGDARASLLALGAGVPARRDAMFAGGRINETEGRAVLHTALRSPEDRIEVDGADITAPVRATLARMRAFAEGVRGGSFTVEGRRVTDVVNVGIGGSDLGPAMAVRALAPYCDGPRVHFVSNVDGADLTDTLRGVDPAGTLVIVASKTLTTLETMTNAESIRRWLAVPDPAAHFAAVSSALERTAAFGIPQERVFGFADWVGGRYSVWGPVGLALMIAIGASRFEEFLSGGACMDAHFRAAPLAGNMPVWLALTGIWHHQGCGYATRAVLPYEERLARLPAYLQQLEMESNGKGVAMDGSPLPLPAGPVVWGEAGTNGQHAFYQLIHQGRQVVPAEFIVTALGHEPALDHHHRLLVANAIAQAQALVRGRTVAEARAGLKGRFAGAELDRQAAHRAFPGNRPSTVLTMGRLTPFALGAIVALYEHRVFVEGVILGINSFDQWGVELGKELAAALAPAIDGPVPEGLDAATAASLARVRALRAGAG